MASDTNSVVLVGRLTKAPEVRSIGSGSVTDLRVAVTSSRKVGEGWEDAPNYFSVSVFGRQGEAASRYLDKGSQVAIAGRLSWREWTDKAGAKRETVSIIASSVQFVGGKPEGGAKATSSAPVEVAPVAPGEDIPF